MSDELKMQANGDLAAKAADGSNTAGETSSNNEVSSGGSRAKSLLSVAALAAAVSLPLIKVRDVQAQSIACSADGFAGQNVDPGDCIDCTYSMFPADCSFSDQTLDNAVDKETDYTSDSTDNTGTDTGGTDGGGSDGGWSGGDSGGGGGDGYGS